MMWKYRGQERPPFAEPTQSGQESVWDYPRPPAVARDARHVIVQAGDSVLADSTAAVRVMETASPPTFYLPADDVDIDQLVAADGQSVCEWKGLARYWVLRAAMAQPAVAWSYPQPTLEFEMLANHFAFYPGRVTCLVDGERVRPQPGEFYGGWVTDELVGPFKGAPGTGHW